MSSKTPKTPKTPDAENEQSATATPPKSGVTPIKKITVKTVCGTPILRELPADGSEIVIMTVAGYASGTQQGTTQYGVWHALLGEFAATNKGTGEIFMSKACILPDVLGDALVDTVSAQLKEDAAASVAFKVSVSVCVSPRDPNKYEYRTRPLMDTAFKSAAMLLLEG